MMAQPHWWSIGELLIMMSVPMSQKKKESE